MESRRIESSDVDRPGPPAGMSTLDNDREETSDLGSNGSQYDEGDLNSSERSSSDDARMKTRGRMFKFGTWNVRTLYQSGKLDNCIREMERVGVDVLGIAETRWTDSGRIDKDGHVFIFSGGDTHNKGVGFLLRKEVSNSLQGYWPISERAIMIKLRGKPFDIVCLQVYAPTQDRSEEEIEAFYADMEVALEQVKHSDILIVMGDMNCKVGSETVGEVVGRYGLGSINDRGERLVDFCEENNLAVMNTFFKQHPRRLYTWSSPGNLYRNQIDYLMISKRHRNSVKNCNTYPGADINSDHCLLVMKVRVKLKIPKKASREIQADLNMLKNPQINAAYNEIIQNRFSVLDIEDVEQNEEIDRMWMELKEGVKSAIEAAVPKQKRRKKNEWITEEILGLMDERRKQKRRSKEYEEIDKEIRRECKLAKEKWYENRCMEIEEDMKNHNMKELHTKVKNLTNRRAHIRTGNNCIKDKNGRVLFEQKEVEARWIEYIQELYDDDDRGEPPMEKEKCGPDITQAEVMHAVKKMKKLKAPGPDKVTTESLKALNETNTKTLTSLCNKIHRSGHIPPDLLESTFITIPKKPKTMECCEHRTISLMSHVLKLILRVIVERNDRRIEQEISDSQSGFRPQRGTREGIFNLRTIIERYLEVDKSIYICFIDYEKAFDRVYHTEIMKSLDRIGIDGKDLNIIRNLYWNQRAAIRLKEGLSTKFPIKRGVRQGCVLSPKLFNIYTEHIFREVENLPGCSVGGININNLRYADDTALIADDPVKLQAIIEKVNSVSENYGLRMNIKKTKTMVISRERTAPEIDMRVNGEKLKQEDEFKYLGQCITNDGRCEKEIRRRIAIAKATFNNMKDVLASRKIRLDVRKRVLNCYVMSTFLYASETWTLSKETEDKIEALEMWCYRRMMRISYRDHITNEEVLEKVKEKRKLLKDIKSRKLQYFGHIIRAEGFQKQILEGKINGRKKRGRPRKSWAGNITQWTRCSYAQLTQMARSRRDWRSMAVEVLRRT